MTPEDYTSEKNMHVTRILCLEAIDIKGRISLASKEKRTKVSTTVRERSDTTVMMFLGVMITIEGVTPYLS